MCSDIPSRADVFRLTPPKKPVSASFPYGLGVSGVHEVCEAQYGDYPALIGFVLATLPPIKGAVFWAMQYATLQDHGQLLRSGLNAMQHQPLAIIEAYARKSVDILWMIEEAMKAGCIGLVIAELTDLSFTASRRLTLAASRYGVPAILLLPHTREGSTAATARWRITSKPSAPNRYDAHAPGYPRWNAALERSRQAPHLSGTNYKLEFDDETLSLTVVSGLAPHQATPHVPRADNWISSPQTRKSA